MSTCGRCGAPTPAGARFCPACGTAVADAPATSQALKTVTLVFTDLVESTALGERLDPESLSSVMREYFETIRAVVARYGGSVEKFIGDAVLAVFGIPALHEDDALRAVSAASAIHRSIDDLNERLRDDAGFVFRIRTGVNTGEVLSQSETDSTGRLVGDAVNVAARLQQAAAPGEVLLGPSTHALVRDRVRVEALDPFVAKGRSTPVEAYRLLEVLPAQRTPMRPRSPIVGRDREARLLRETLQRVAEERTPHLFTVLGPPGIGKSRLVAELEETDEAVVLHGRCLPYGEGITYWPLAEMVQRAAGIESDDPPDVARTKLVASAGGDADSETVAERMAHVFALAETPGTTDELSWAVRRYFEHLAAGRPHVLVFDDVHWGENALLDLIEQLVDQIAEIPLLVVCVARLELLEIRPGWGGGKLNASSLVLGPLKDPDCRALVGGLLGESPSLDQVAEAVFPVADGNPLFVEEMVSMLVDEGLLDHSGGRWVATRELASLTVPRTIQALVSARLDRLTPSEREIVGIAAVMGKVFAPQAVSALAPETGDAVYDALARLTRKQLVGPEDAEFAGERIYSFRHLLIRDTAYEHLPRMTRATIHERYAEWLVKVLGDRIAEYDEILGYHLEQAHRYQSRMGLIGGRTDLAAKAAERLADAGRRALARQDTGAAVKLLSRAAELLDRSDALRLTVLPDLGRALYESGEHTAAVEAFDAAIALAKEERDETVETRSRIFREVARIHRDPEVDAEESLGVAEQAVTTLTGTGDDYGLCYAWNLLAYIHDCAGRSDDALEALRHAAAHADRSGVPSTVAHQKRALLRSLAWGPGTVAEVIPLARELLAWSRERHDRYSESRALLTLAHAHAMSGAFDEARACIARQEDVCSDVSFQFVSSWGAFEKAQVEILAGDLAAAERHARAGYDFLSRKNEHAMLPTLQTLLADVRYMRGDLDEALALSQTARGASTPDDALTEMKWRAVIAKVTARLGDLDAAVALADEAVTKAVGTGYVDWHAGVLADRAEVLALAGRAHDSREAYTRAAALYARKGNVVAERVVRGAAARTVSA